jgi:hypothetical protein
MAVSSSRDGKLCMLYDSSTWRQKETNVGNDDDTKNDMLYLDDRAIFMMAAAKRKGPFRGALITKECSWRIKWEENISFMAGRMPM